MITLFGSLNIVFCLVFDSEKNSADFLDSVAGLTQAGSETIATTGRSRDRKRKQQHFPLLEAGVRRKKRYTFVKEFAKRLLYKRHTDINV